jgi:beta-glucosidase
VRGFQGTNLSDAGTLAACAKHFCAYGAVTAGRDYAATDVPPRALREIHLPPFEAAVAAGVATIMPAFTALDGVPMSAHRALLKNYLRETLGFSGALVSDYNAIAELIHHGVAADIVEAAALALNAGIDIDMMANAYHAGLPGALERGLVTMKQIDSAVRRILVLKEQLGLFENPYRGGGPENAAILASRRQLAREVAARSIVLLKNDNAALPLGDGPLAVIGPRLLARGRRGCGLRQHARWLAQGPSRPTNSLCSGGGH